MKLKAKKSDVHNLHIRKLQNMHFRKLHNTGGRSSKRMRKMKPNSKLNWAISSQKVPTKTARNSCFFIFVKSDEKVC